MGNWRGVPVPVDRNFRAAVRSSGAAPCLPCRAGRPTRPSYTLPNAPVAIGSPTSQAPTRYPLGTVTAYGSAHRLHPAAARGETSGRPPVDEFEAERERNQRLLLAVEARARVGLVRTGLQAQLHRQVVDVPLHRSTGRGGQFGRSRLRPGPPWAVGVRGAPQTGLAQGGEHREVALGAVDGEGGGRGRAVEPPAEAR